MRLERSAAILNYSYVFDIEVYFDLLWDNSIVISVDGVPATLGHINGWTNFIPCKEVLFLVRIYFVRSTNINIWLLQMNSI